MGSKNSGWILGFRNGFLDFGVDSGAGLGFWAGFLDCGAGCWDLRLDSGILGWTLGFRSGF